MEIKKMNENNIKYKSGQLFWGFFFLTIGILFLLDKNDVVINPISNIWEYWPLLILLWGISILAKGTFIKPLISALAGIFLGLFISGSILGIEENIDLDNEPNHEYTVSTFQEDYRDSTEIATLSLRTGIGKISISGTTDKLIEGTSSGFYDTFKFSTRYRDNNARIVFRHSNDDFEIMNDNKSHKLDISLNQNPEWEIDVQVGAAKVNLDFSQYNVSKFNLQTGATTTNLTFSDKQKRVKANIEMGAATLKINIPNETGCMIKGDMVMMIKDLEDFEKIDGRRYKSYNFDNSINKIYINLDGGVSTLEVKRY